MKKALIVVDYQYDFVADDGKLTAGGPAQDIEGNIVELVEAMKGSGDYKGVVFTYDCHYIGDFENHEHPEGAVFPAHCIEGEQGYHYFNRLASYEIMENSSIEFIKKRGYALDSATVKRLVNEYDEFVFAGVVTDICVFQNVIAFYNESVNSGKNVKITVDSRACASFAPERETFSLQYMKEVLGAEIL